MKRIHLFTHWIDMDGITCYLLLQSYCNLNNINLQLHPIKFYTELPTQIKEIELLVKNEEHVILSDICLHHDEQREEIKKLLITHHEHLTIIDHHTETIQMLKELKYKHKNIKDSRFTVIHEDVHNSACVIMMRYLESKKHRFTKYQIELVKTVSAFDTWDIDNRRINQDLVFALQFFFLQHRHDEYRKLFTNPNWDKNVMSFYEKNIFKVNELKTLLNNHSGVIKKDKLVYMHIINIPFTSQNVGLTQELVELLAYSLCLSSKNVILVTGKDIYIMKGRNNNIQKYFKLFNRENIENPDKTQLHYTLFNGLMYALI